MRISLFRRLLRSLGLLLAGFAIFVLIWAAIGAIADMYDFWDSDPDRGAVVVQNDHLGEQYSEIIYLPQGWDESDSLWFYKTTQGSNLLPYDFFLFLEQADSTDPFKSNENINRYRYLPQKEDMFSNPDGLPVGMAKDTYQGKAYMGFTCAACHTTQIVYRDAADQNDKGVAIRIDGGPAAADFDTFLVDLAKSMRNTLDDKQKLDRFTKKVVNKGEYKTPGEVQDDLTKFYERIATYNAINRPKHPSRPLTTYGYARLDAFGRIYNRVLEHLVSAKQLKQVLAKLLPPKKYAAVLARLEPVLSAEERDHLLRDSWPILSTDLTLKEQLALRNELFNPADAPVSYPFLWDIPQHDYVQWNGVVGNSSIGPMGRNAGQVIGVFGTLDWREEDGFTISSILGGQGLGSSYIEFNSSIDIRNLRRVEKHLRKLKSPEWPSKIFPAIDEKAWVRGKEVFDLHCESCHRNIERDSRQRRVIAHMSRLSSIGTDPKMANNSVEFRGYSGILEGQYVETDVGKIYLEGQSEVAALLTAATRNVVITPDPDKWLPRRWAERVWDFFKAIVENNVKPSIKRGDYEPDTTANPFASLKAYKARSLNGIWATAPYLHNGSVPTLYDLLLPKKVSQDELQELGLDCVEPNIEYRPDTFMVGSREFDVEKIGFKTSGYPGFEFRTSIPGNFNGGHQYPPRKPCEPNPLSELQRADLLEYLKDPK
jgi:cytochrome c5